MAFTGRYTPNETKLMEILKEHGPADSKWIVKVHYARRRRPRYAQKSVVSVLNALIRKTQRNREKFRIVKTRRCGPYPITFHMERS